jgi:hypothetical protein
MKYTILGVFQLLIINSMAMELPSDKLVSDWESIEFGTYSGSPLIRYYSRDKKDREQINHMTCNSSQVTLDLASKGIYNLAKIETLAKRINRFDVLGLDLAHNHIRAFCIKELRAAFPNLIFLDLRNNEITRLTASHLEGIPINFGLLLSSNKIATLDQNIIKAIFCPMINKDKVSVTTSSIPLCKTYDTTLKLWQRYQKNCGAIDLSNNQIDPNHIKKIKEFLENCTELPWHEKMIQSVASLGKEEPKKHGFEIVFDDK